MDGGIGGNKTREERGVEGGGLDEVEDGDE